MHRFSTRPGSKLLTFCVFVLCAVPPLFADSKGARGNPEFRWIQEATEPDLWSEIKSAFQVELAPDQPAPGKDALDVYRYKYLQRIGIINHSAVVFVGHRPAKQMTKENDWDEYYSAFNFDISTHQKTKIDQADWLWEVDFGSMMTLGPFRFPDITFTYLSCTECEPELIFAALEYDPQKPTWEIRPWGDGQLVWWATRQGLVVGMDEYDGGDIISFDCAYGALNSGKGGLQDLAIRCKEVGYAESGKLKIEDSTLVYSSADGRFTKRRVVDLSEIASLNARICRKPNRSSLCKLPFYLTATQGQSTVLMEMFRAAPKTTRDLASFRKLTPNMTMNEVVQQCGRPDELAGSGISIFIYHLDDGSLVAIGDTDAKAPILYADHIDRDGGSQPIIEMKK